MTLRSRRGSAIGTRETLEVEGVQVSVIRYSYPLLQPAEEIADLGARAASLQDLACMKLSAIAGRGKARDFWDLHEILTRSSIALERLLGAYERKYRQEDVGHVVRSLVYFADADVEPLPEGLTPAHWAKIKGDLQQRVLALPA